MIEPHATEAPITTQALRPVSRPVIAISGANDDPTVAMAIERGGGAIGPLDSADALVHLDSADALPTLPDRIRWVQLPSAGIETYLDDIRLDRTRIWTSAAGAYAATVAEHAVGLLLAGVRGLVTSARSNKWRPEVVEPYVTGLAGATVAIVGAGGIGRRASELLVTFGASVIAVNRSGSAVPGVGCCVANRLGYTTKALEMQWKQDALLLSLARRQALARRLSHGSRPLAASWLPRT